MLNKLYEDLVAFAKAEGKKVEDVLEHAKVFLEGKIAEHKGEAIEGESVPAADGESASGNETVVAAPVAEPTTEAPVVEPTAPVVEPAT